MALTKEVLWRAQIDEYACVSIQRVTRILDDEDEQAVERYWRAVVTPDDDLAGLAAQYSIPPAAASRLADIINAARYPEAVARYETRKAAALDALNPPA